MGWINWIPDIFKGSEKLVEEFKVNTEAESKRSHLERMAESNQDANLLHQFTQEFHQRTNRTAWDSFVDGLNRLPRPLMTISVLSFFVLAPLDPERFIQISQAYEAMPPGYWALLSIIVSFYFGGRMQLKSHDMALKGDALKAAKELVSMRKEFSQQNDNKNKDKVTPSLSEVHQEEPKNTVVREWLKTK